MSLVQLVQPMDNYQGDVGQSMLQQLGAEGNSSISMVSSSSSQATLIKAGLYTLSLAYLFLKIPLDPQACKVCVCVCVVDWICMFISCILADHHGCACCRPSFY